METAMRFCDVVEAADRLSEDEQMTLIELLRRRQLERRRDALLAACKESDADFKAGRCKTGTVEELMKEILS